MLLLGGGGVHAYFEACRVGLVFGLLNSSMIGQCLGWGGGYVGREEG